MDSNSNLGTVHLDHTHRHTLPEETSWIGLCVICVFENENWKCTFLRHSPVCVNVCNMEISAEVDKKHLWWLFDFCMEHFDWSCLIPRKKMNWNKCDYPSQSGFQCCTASPAVRECSYRGQCFHTSPLCLTSVVWRLSAASSSTYFTQHCDGAGGRRLDGSGWVPGEERPLSRWVKKFTRSHKAQLID